jgi:hypothetical protein
VPHKPQRTKVSWSLAFSVASVAASASHYLFSLLTISSFCTSEERDWDTIQVCLLQDVKGGD